MKLVVYDAAWISHLDRLKRAMKTDWEVHFGSEDLKWLEKEIIDADALLALSLPAAARLLAGRLRLLLTPGAGIHSASDELPLGCSLCNVYEHEVPVAEYVLMMALMHTTQILRHSQSFRRGHWSGSGRVGGEPHGELFGQTMGIIGYGHIGQSIAVRARAFGMRISILSRTAGKKVSATAAPPDFVFGPDEASGFFSSCDFIVVACPLTDASRGLIGANEIQMMRRSAVLINVSRGEVVQEEPLYEALRDRRIEAAALDVWYQYPTSKTEALHGSRLPFHELPNVLGTPHYSAWTEAMIERRCRKMAGNLDRLALGRELERVVLIGSWRPD